MATMRRGAPHLVVESLSPSTAQKDLKIKFARYERAGVQEYRVVDPAGRTVQLVTLGADSRYGRPQVYVDGDLARVGIFPELENRPGCAVCVTESESCRVRREQ